MSELQRWWHHVGRLATTTGRAWWRLLPALLGVQLVCFALVQTALLFTGAISGDHPWLAVVILSAAMLVKLTAAVICLRWVGRVLGLDDLVGSGGRRGSMLAVLAATLLPFLGIYSVFGQLDTMARTVVVSEIVQRGTFSTSMLAVLNPSTGRRIWVLLAVLIAAYVVRRALDLLHERTGWTPLGLAAAICEAFFMVVFLFSGTRLVRQALDWLGDSRVGGWWLEWRDGFLTAAGWLSDGLPEVLVRFGEFASSTFWPLLSNALVEPVLWLAVAALIFGSQAINLGQMWRIGEPEAVARAQDEQEETRERRRRASRRRQAGATRRVVIELQEALFGDMDDKYLPAILSVRLMLRSGVLFLGAFVLLYALVTSAGRLLEMGIVALTPGGSSTFWVTWSQVLLVLHEPLLESLRLALLGAAATLALNRMREDDPNALPAAPSGAVAHAVNRPGVGRHG